MQKNFITESKNMLNALQNQKTNAIRTNIFCLLLKSKL